MKKVYVSLADKTMITLFVPFGESKMETMLNFSANYGVKISDIKKWVYA